MIQPERTPYQDAILTATVILVLAGIFLGFAFLDQPAKAKEITPIPTMATPEPTMEPIMEPTPEPTPDYTSCEAGCSPMREWRMWYREDANNFGEFLKAQITVYQYKVLPYYHYYSVSWARPFKVSPEPGMEFLFIFVNMYADEYSTRQYIFEQDHFALQIRDKIYYPDDVESPERRITEFDDVYNLAHVETPGPWGWKRIQEAGTGIIRAEYQPILYAGRSNAADGWIRYQVPIGTNISEVKVCANLANLGGNVWWALV